MKLQRVILLILVPVLISCEEKIEWDLQTGTFDQVVIDAMITNEYTYQTVRLSKPVPDANSAVVPLSGAGITISTGSASLFFAEQSDLPGTYLSIVKAAGTIDKTYTLTVIYQGREYTAEAFMIPVIPSWPLVIVPAGDPDTLRQIQWIAPAYNPDEMAMYQVDVDWSHLPGYDPSDTLTRARLYRYTLNTIDVNYIIFPQDKEEVFFPVGSILIARKFSVNENYGNYLRALLSETEWQGSLFEEIRGNLPTNISNGGLGYFSACSVVADTLIVD